MDHLRKILRILIWCIVDISIIAAIGLGFLIIHLESELPDVTALNELQMQVPLRVFSADGKLMAEFGEKRRIPIPYEKIPKLLIAAVLATEDQRFFQHPGVDFRGLARAAVQVATTGIKSQGGSTITMQVARNFFLSPQKTYTRKLKEILLAMRIEQGLSKEKILDLYLNKIYFGNRAYGVAAASQAYYGKTLDELTLAEMAMLAGLPKAPSALNPIYNPVAAKERRDHVLKKMLDQGYISQKSFDEAIKAPLTANYHEIIINQEAPYIAEMVRNAMVSQFGEEKAYTYGYNVYTTIDSHLQQEANKALRDTLIAYDHRHGYKGPVKHFKIDSNKTHRDLQRLIASIPSSGDLIPGIVINVNSQSVQVLRNKGDVVTINWDGLSWAKKYGQTHASDILKEGDVIYTQEVNQSFKLAQIPKAQAAIISVNPQNGAITALCGGFDFYLSKFNRVTQAKRQPGSSFKPFIYAAGLQKGFTLASTINDAPIVVNAPDGTLWRPQNATKEFYGPTRLRVALVKSRNLVSVRLLQMVGIRYTIKYLQNFGFSPSELPHSLSLALGTASLTPLELAAGYVIFANGGYQVRPYFIDHITNAAGHSLYQSAPLVACEECLLNETPKKWENPDHSNITDKTDDTSHLQNIAPVAISPQIAYLMTSAMKDVIQHGTGWRARSLGRQDIAGKTGTTNDQKDGWFAGFNSDLVTISWIGFDQPISLNEYGAQTAQPMWIEFMTKALAGKPEHTMPQPPGISVVQIDPATGNPTYASKSAIPELFRTENSSHYANEDKALPPPAPSANDWVNPDGGSAAKNSVNLPAMALGGKQDQEMDGEEEEKLETATTGKHNQNGDDDGDSASAEGTTRILPTENTIAADLQVENTTPAEIPATAPPEKVAINDTANELARQALEDVNKAEEPLSLF